jgi:hypothetical protein
MADINWLHWIIIFVSGGAVGAIIKIIFSAYRSRIQTIGRRITLLPIFRKAGNASTLSASIATRHNNTLYTFTNLFLAEIQIINRGNTDLKNFEFGITLGKGDGCIHLESFSPDRHHIVNLKTEVNPENPRSEIDFEIVTFNRKDLFTFKLYIVIPGDKEEPQKIELSSPNAIKFVEVPSVPEIVASLAENFIVGVGPLRISMKIK